MLTHTMHHVRRVELIVFLMSSALLLALVMMARSHPAAAQDNDDWPTITLMPTVSGLDNPIHVTHAGDSSSRLFVIEQEGRIRIIADDVLLDAPFLDITERVACCGEQGLLSVAFPPDFANKQFFYVNYTRQPDGATIIARFPVDADNPDQADAAGEEVLLTIEQPEANHNGGQLAFGPDGYLYIGMGDGGGAGDLDNNAQTSDTLLGKMLRIDVESDTAPYTIPPDNPYVADEDYAAEIWALGLRNPWRFSFDRATGDLYIADVGQGSYEEINFQPTTSAGGENYGWRCKEGNQDFNFADICPDLTLVPPIHEYGRSEGRSVTGGFVYRGTRYPTLQGIYVYGDFGSGRIWGLRRNGDNWQNRLLQETGKPFNISSFGEDEAGNLYMAGYNDGIIYQISVPSRFDNVLHLPIIVR